MEDIHWQHTLDMTLVPGGQGEPLPGDQIPDHPSAGGVARDQVAAGYLGAHSDHCTLW